jgi:hypothetical protein
VAHCQPDSYRTKGSQGRDFVQEGMNRQLARWLR